MVKWDDIPLLISIHVTLPVCILQVDATRNNVGFMYDFKLVVRVNGVKG